MIGPMPDFMKKPEWEEYETRDDSAHGFKWRLKSGAPEWLQKEFKEYRDKQLFGKKYSGAITQDEYEEEIKKSIFIDEE